MTSTHISVALSNSTGHTQVAVLPVHVVGARTRVVTQPDTEVLDFNRCLLVDGFHVDNFSGGLLELTQLSQEVPETRLGHDLVGREDAHFVQRSSLLLLCGQFAPDHFELLQLKHKNTISTYIESAIICVALVRFYG